MLSLEEYKEALGEELLKELSEEQVIELKHSQEELAQLAFDMWLEDKRNKKLPE